jgi:hypothetical protein
MTEFRRVVAQTVACRRQFVADETGTNIKEVLYDKIAAALAGM